MKLNLGCGKDYIDEWVNVDFYDDTKCDVIHNLEEFPWPWENDSVSEIRIIHTLEHLGADWKVYIKILQEMYRICEDDAMIMCTFQVRGIGITFQTHLMFGQLHQMD